MCARLEEGVDRIGAFLATVARQSLGRASRNAAAPGKEMTHSMSLIRRSLFVLFPMLAATVFAGPSAGADMQAGSGDGGCAITDEGDARTDSARSFTAWLEDYKAQAIGCGISTVTTEAAFRGVRPSETVRRLDRRQPEYNRTFFGYLGTRVTDGMVRTGRDRIGKYSTLLEEIERRYGVEAEVLTAIWGLESGFGANIGDIPVISALSTLAHDGRRSAFYRRELLSALRILERGDTDPNRMPGSWAGAMGQTQLMPSTFLAHAVNADGDGRIDVWGSVPDALSSAANYLKSIGWISGQPWGREVSLPQGFDAYQARLDLRMPVDSWGGQGILRADGRSLPATDPVGSVILPAGIGGPAFLVYDNFRVLTEWNRSLFYALSVGHLSDGLAGGGGLVGRAPPGDAPLRTDAVMAMQRDLNALGYAAGEPDGMVGRQTRRALRDYQRDRGLPADAYPTRRLIEMLQAEIRGGASPPAAP